MPRIKTAAGTIAEVGEFGLIGRIKGAPPGGDASVALGIGDDAAALRPSPGMLLLATCDVQVEGRHFVRERMTPQQLGRRCAAINLSDIAAMGGRPRWTLVSLGLRGDTAAAWVDALYRGMREEFARYGVAIVGGNMTSVAKDALVDITLLGEVAEGEMVLRSGAHAGEAILAAGDFGASLLGRLALEAGKSGHVALYRRAIAAHLTPQPRVEEGRTIAATRMATAMIDVSDGLAADLAHICERSGVGARLYAERIPIAPETRRVAAALGMEALQAALHGGEDFALVATCPKRDAAALAERVRRETGTEMAVIGETTFSTGMTLVAEDGTEQELAPRGWDHFRREA